MSLLEDLGWAYLAITADGREFTFGNPEAAWNQLVVLDVAGRVEFVSQDPDEPLRIMFTRHTDGVWASPNPPEFDEDEP